jgi:hypothetical protein
MYSTYGPLRYRYNGPVPHSRKLPDKSFPTAAEAARWLLLVQKGNFTKYRIFGPVSVLNSHPNNSVCNLIVCCMF